MHMKTTGHRNDDQYITSRWYYGPWTLHYVNEMAVLGLLCIILKRQLSTVITSTYGSSTAKSPSNSTFVASNNTYMGLDRQVPKFRLDLLVRNKECRKRSWPLTLNERQVISLGWNKEMNRSWSLERAYSSEVGTRLE